MGNIQSVLKRDIQIAPRGEDKIVIVEPGISFCEIDGCAFNTNRRCRASKISIGRGDNPTCLSFKESRAKEGKQDILSKVEACKIAGCIHNIALNCTAENVRIGTNEYLPDCDTFVPVPEENHGSK